MSFLKNLFAGSPKVGGFLTETELAAKLNGKRVLIVGGTAGIGKAVALSVLNRGGEVSIVGRRKPDESLAKAKFISKDLSLMRNAEALIGELEIAKYDIVLFTNGIIAANARQESAEGLELDLAVSYLSRFVICRGFDDGKLGVDRPDKSVKPRVFVMAYPGQKLDIDTSDFNSEKTYSAFPVHMKTVIGNEALVFHLADKNPDLNVYGLNPGLIKTEIRDNLLGKGSWLSNIIETLIGLFSQSAENYSEKVICQLLVSAELEGKNKAMIDAKAHYLEPNPKLAIDSNQEKVIKVSEELVERALKAELKPLTNN